MLLEEIIEELKKTGRLTIDTAFEIEEDRNIRLELIKYFEKNKDRDLAQALLKTFAELRKNFNWGDDETQISGDTIMLACYILGMHGEIEDCLEIWKAKTIDFDTFCYIDIQLVPFVGVQETIEYLKTSKNEYAVDALKYMNECLEAGDFDNIEQYYKQTPWFV